MAAAARRLDGRKISNKTAEVVTATVRPEIGGDDDGSDEMTETETTQARNSSDETAAVAAATVRAGLGGNGGNEMTETAEAQASNSSDETAAVATATARTGIGGNVGNKMTETAAAQDWLVIRRWQQRDNGDCGGNGGGANLDWLGGSGKTARQHQMQ